MTPEHSWRSSSPISDADTTRGREGAFTRLGEWLFPRRSALPLLLLPVLGLSCLVGAPAAAGVGAWHVLATGLMASGLALRAVVVGHAPARTSVRNVRRFQAETLSTAGAYSVVRHPLYLANILVSAGLIVLLREPVGVALGVGVITVVYSAIGSAEDAFLTNRFGTAHARWRARTPALLPLADRWRPSPLPFSFRTVLRKEHPTWLAVPILALALDTWIRVRTGGNPVVSQVWMWVTGLAAIAFAALRTLKYRTRVLHVDGR